jgi:hypothetical protein
LNDLYDYDENNIKSLVCSDSAGYTAHVNDDALRDLIFGLDGLSRTFRLYEDISIRSDGKLEKRCNRPVVILEILSVALSDAEKPGFARTRITPASKGRIRADVYVTRPEAHEACEALRRLYDQGAHAKILIFGTVTISWEDREFFADCNRL